jgi:lipoate-protein ligase A
MKLNINAVQRQLDISAEELDKEGFKDLAEKLDAISEELPSVNIDKIPEIKAKLVALVKEKESRTAKREELLTKIKDKLTKMKANKDLRKARKERLKEKE